jgi:CTP synthase (UTP-ammonia lyase)
MPDPILDDAGADDAAVVHLAIIGEYDAAFEPHRAVDATIAQVRSARGIDVRAHWISTEAIEGDGTAQLAAFDGIWISPGSPYRSLDGALESIRFARERGVPLLGTCGGFQHVVLEYARNVMGLANAQHAEMSPHEGELLITPLTCSPAGQTMPITIDGASRVAGWYGATRAVERYYCNYGLNPDYEAAVEAAGLRVVAWDDGGEPRVVDLPSHPFYIGTLFVPQPSAEPDSPHALVAAFVEAGRLARADRGLLRPVA